ncbi:metallophosphoesterase family protein [Lederbergia lenta]|uniref:metallophosphoesterase family protein n=1 Tax=Lederbergia lenta TaxID=1467 RepID=UPI00203ACDD3|nr:metallophosphoesterase [Lederbergia lenta]MCM3109860.1 metallophosphoesterase family protein [Lederbergia lenta]
MTMYFISDTHFSHRNILDFENRPYYSVEEMDEIMIENWNSTISNEDIVYHLGDFCLSNQDRHIEIIKRLNGKIRIVKGNHDYSNTMKKLHPYLDEYHEVGQYIKASKQQIWLTHYPMQIGIRPKKWSISGHIHSYPNHDINQLNVGCDSDLMLKIFKLKHGQPVSLERLLFHMESLAPEIERIFEKERGVR